MKTLVPSNLYYQRCSLFTGEELLLLQAPLTPAALTTQRHLERAFLTLAQVLLSKVCKGLDEYGAAVQTFGPLDTRGIRLFHDFEIQLIQGLNVVAGEGDRYEDNVGLSTLHVLLDGIACLRSQPSPWSDLRLPAEAVRVAKIEPLHHRMHCCRNLGRVWIT